MTFPLRLCTYDYYYELSLFCVWLMLAGVCQPRVVGTVGAEPFSAKLRYTGTEDSEHPNLIKLTVTMPHIDGRS